MVFLNKLSRLIGALYLIVVCLTLSVGHANDAAPVHQIASLQVFTGPLDAVAFSPDGSKIATGGRDNHLHLWDAHSGELILSINAHTDWLTSVVFHPNGSMLASASRDNSIKLWDVITGALIRVIGNHRGDISSLAFNPDGSILISGARDSLIKLHDVATATEITAFENFGGPVWDLAFSPDGTYFASASEDGSIWLWGLWSDSGAWVRRYRGHEGAAVTLAFTDDGSRLLSGGLDGLIYLWDLTPTSSVHVEDHLAVFRGHLAPIMGLAFTTDGEIAASASLDGTVRLWDTTGTIELGQELAVIHANGAPLTNLTINPDRTEAASVGTDGILNLWDVGAETVREVIASNRPATIVQQPVTRSAQSVALVPSSPVNPAAIAPRPTPIAPQPITPPPTGGRMLTIPSANISVGVNTYYLDGTSWAIDPWDSATGHLQGTAWLDRTGNIAIGGHSEYPNGRAGVFYRLYNVNIGDEIYLSDGDIQRRYIVTEIRSVDYRDLSVVYPTAHNRLTLITCDIPSYVASSNFYYERLIVIADEAS